MNRNIGFQKNALRRNILWNGKLYEFKRNEVNKYGEKQDGQYEAETYLIKGIFHKVTSRNLYITIDGGEAARVQSKSAPMIICLFDDISSKLKIDDKLMMNGQLYRVNGIEDINGEQAFLDISLEVIA